MLPKSKKLNSQNTVCMNKHHQHESSATTKIQQHAQKKVSILCSWLWHIAVKNRSTFISPVQFLSLVKHEHDISPSTPTTYPQIVAFTVLNNWQAWRLKIE